MPDPVDINDDGIKTYQLPETYDDNAHYGLHGTGSGFSTSKEDKNERFDRYFFNHNRYDNVPNYNSHIMLESEVSDVERDTSPTITLAGNLYYPRAFVEKGGAVSLSAEETNAEGYERIDFKPLIEQMIKNEHFVLILEASADENGR